MIKQTIAIVAITLGIVAVSANTALALTATTTQAECGVLGGTWTPTSGDSGLCRYTL
jgi:hypothetical protein